MIGRTLRYLVRVSILREMLFYIRMIRSTWSYIPPTSSPNVAPTVYKLEVVLENEPAVRPLPPARMYIDHVALVDYDVWTANCAD